MRGGIVYLIGAGPGDPGLITVRGRDLLSRCDVVLYDALAHPSLLDHTRDDCERRFVGKRGGQYETPQHEINAQLVALAKEGKVVGRLKGGDPLLFARGAEEALFLADHGVPFEIVPGISSPVAASAYAGIPLTHRDHASSVLFLTGTPREGTGPDGHDYQKLATRAGTICVLMGLSRIREIAAALIQYGRDRDTPSAVIQWGSWTKQRVVEAPLHALADAVERERIAGPALIVIGRVVELRARLRWFELRPLFGKRVLVTRAREQAGELSTRLSDLGAEPVLSPTIAVRPVLDAGLDDAVRRAATFDVVAFTSANGVRFTFDALARVGLDARAFGAAKVAAVGPGTAKALLARGIRADLVADDHGGEGLAATIIAACPAPRVMLFRAKVGRDELPLAVRRAGGDVEIVTAYQTIPAGAAGASTIVAALEQRQLDIITLMSPSAVENLAAQLGERAAELLASVALVSIGPVTTRAIDALGWTAAATAPVHSLDGLLDELVRYVASSASSASTSGGGAAGSGGSSNPSV